MLNRIIPFDNNDVLLLAEYYFVHVETTTSRNSIISHSTWYYNAENIYAFFVSPNGDCKIKVVEKKQHSTNNDGVNLSYNTVWDKDNVYVLYVDNIKNKKGGKKKYNYDNRNKGVLACVKLNKNEDVKKFYMNDLSEYNQDFYLRKFRRFNEKVVIGIAYKNRKQQLVKIAIN
ncbi:MAG: hypothetical protein R2831_08030 [Chitinophagaceae bacterium]